MKHNKNLSLKFYRNCFLINLFIFTIIFNNVFGQSPVTFNYTGNVQTWIVPPCVTTINVTVAGAKGGGTNGGNGGVVQGSIAVTPGQVLNIYCGGMGTQGAVSGGWNGGGTGHNSTGSATYRSWGGGGASDIRIGGTALANRVVVAGGGGGRSGGSTPVCGGAGGGTIGTAGCSTFGAGGGGGTQTAGGAGGAPWAGTPPGGSPGILGIGGQGGYWQTASGGGGGGGRYGGGGGGNDGCCTGANAGGGGGGGSCLLPPIAGVFLGATNAQNGYVTISFNVGPGNATATNTGPYCAGTTIQLNGTGGASYSWTGPNGFTSNVQNPTIPVSIVANSGTYTLTATSPGCVSTATTNVVVNPIPALDAGPNQSICQNTQVTLTGTGATTYTWTGGVINGVSFIPPVGTNTYFLTGTALGCTAIDNVTITVNPNPTVNAGADQTICAGNQVTLTAVPVGTTNVSWNNGVVDGVPFSPTVTQTYTVIATTTFSCTATDNVLVTVNPLPIVNGGSDQTVCENTSVTLTATGANNYSWNNGVTNGVAFIPTVGSVSYVVTGTSAFNCNNTDTVVVTVNPNPVPVITGPTSYCANIIPTLNTTLPYSSYNWTTGITTASTTANQLNNPISVTVSNNFNCSATSAPYNLVELPVITTNSNVNICQGQSATIHGIAQTTSGTYTATFTSVIGCDSISNVTLTVLALPPVNGGIDQTVCENSTVTLTASGANTYVWTNGITNAVSFTPSVGSLTYIVTGTDNNQCSNTDTVVVTVNPNPVPVITGPTSYCANIIPTLNTTLPYSSYNWTTGITTASTTANQLNNPITVTVTNNFNCSATSAQYSLVELPVITTNSNISICQGQSATIHGIAQTTSGTYTATFTSVIGCDSISNVTLTVLALPPVSAGVDQTVCENSTVTLTATGANTFVWTNGITNAVGFTPNVGSLTYIVTGTDNNQCSNSDTVVVTVNPNPVPVITGPLTYCANVPPTLATTLPYASYNWTTGVTASSTGATQANNPITVTVTNNFNCSATSAAFNLTELATITTNSSISICQGQSVVIHGISQNTSGVYTGNYLNVVGCDSVSNVTLTVLTLPAVNGGSDKIVCEGTQVTITATGANNYVWTGGITNGVPFTQPPGSVTYIVSGTDNNQCSNSDTVVVTVNTLPNVNAGLDQEICSGETVTLSGSGASTYAWTSNVIDGVAFTPTATQTYTVTGTDINGCQDTDQVTITVNQNPTVYAGADLTICDNTNITLTGTGANSYLWNNGVVNGVAFAPGSPGTYNYTVTGDDNNGCQDTDDVTVTVIANPNVSFVADVTAGCVPLNVNFTNTGDSGVNCTWSMGDGTIITDCGSVNHLFTQFGCNDITLTVTNSTGCVESQVLANYICVEGPPTASFIATPSVINEFESTVAFNNTTANASNYVWDFGDNSGSTDADPVHEYDGTVVSNYTVTLYAYSALGCIDSVQGAIQYQEQLIYYVPNSFTPDGDMYNQTFKPIFTSGFDPYNYALYIYDRWGELIFESKNSEYGWDGSYLGKLVQEGTYTWVIEFKAPNTDKKFVETGYVNFLK